MKKISIILSVAIVCFVTSCGLLGTKDKRLKFDNAITYNDYIIDIIDIIEADWDATMDEKEQKKALVCCDSLASHSKLGLAKLNNLQPYKKDSTFRDAVKEYITHMNSIATKELPEFMNIITTDAVLTEEGVKRTDELIPILDAKRIDLFDNAVKVQKEFSAKHNYTIKN